MAWSLFIDEHKREYAINILRKGITQKYLITNNSEIKIGVMHLKSTNECRWMLTIKDIISVGYVIELITLENSITSTNNPLIKDVANFNNTFKQVYNELLLEIDFNGNLIAVKNAGDVRRKWLQIRDDLKQMPAQKPGVNDVIKLNDDLFNSDKNLFEVIKSMEFFELFFVGFYGKEMPAGCSKIRGSKFRGNKLEWEYRFYQDDLNKYDIKTKPHIISVNGKVTNHFTEAFIKTTYGHFDFVDYKKIKARAESKGEYHVDKISGLITHGRCSNDEIVDPEMLYSKNDYTIKAIE